MPKNFSGSTRSLSLDGVEYNVAADADIGSTLSKWGKDVIVTSGDSTIKLTKVNQKKTGFDVTANAEEREELKTLADSFENIKVVYVNTAGDEYHCQGTISLGEAMSQNNKVPVSVFPMNGDWTVVYA